MKKILLFALLLLALVALPAQAANYYVAGYVDESGGSCESQESCKTKIDYILAAAIIAGDCITDNVSNRSVGDWSLVKVECMDTGYYADLQGDSLIDILPLVSFDVKRSSMGAGAVDSLGDIITKYSITGNCGSSSLDAYRDVLRCLGQQLVLSWTEAAWSYF